MKQIITRSALLMIAVGIAFGFSALDEKGKVHLKVTKEENGEKTVFEKSYENMEALKADDELKQFDLLVKNWADDKGTHSHQFNFKSEDGQKVIIERKTDSDEDFTWISEDENHDGEKHIITKRKGDGEIEGNVENVIKIKTKDGDQNFTMKIDGDDNGTMIWVDEHGNTTELTDEKISEMVSEHTDGDSEIKIRKKVEVITSEGKEGVHKVIIKEGNDDTAEIEVNVEKEMDEDGNEKIVSKKVWITKDGEKVELKDEDAYQFETEGDKIKVTVGDKTLELADFSGGRFEGKDGLIAMNSSNRDQEGDQIMNVNVEKKNGETFIEIDIKRNTARNVTISEIAKEDASFKDVSFTLKNNLKPSQLNYYPNPSNGKFNLKFDLDQKGAVTVKVTDILGKEVYRETILDFAGTYDNQLDLTGRENGIYVLQIIQDRKMLYRKILIE
jgi:hypothetical protein